MTSKMTTVLAGMSTVWEALTPPDRAEVLYRRAVGRDKGNAGASADRSFFFELSGGSVRTEAGAAYAEYDHRFFAKFTLACGRYTQDDFECRVANEAIQLMRAIDTYAVSWGAGINNVFSQGYFVGGRSKDAVELSLSFLAYVQEE